MGRGGVRRHETGTARSRHGWAWVRRQGTEGQQGDTGGCSLRWGGGDPGVGAHTGVGAPGPVVEPAVADEVRKRPAAVEERRKR